MKWVKSSDRLPVKEGAYIVKEMYTDNVSKRFFTGTVFENYQGYRVTEWLDESESPSPQEQGWRAVEDDIPDGGALVWLIEDGGVMLEAFKWIPRGFNGNEHPYFYGMKSKQTAAPYEVTHWMPLPAPPTK